MNDEPDRQDVEDNDNVLSLSRDSKQVMIAAVVAAGIALAGMLLVNVSSGVEARLLLEAMHPSILFFSSSVMTASATILALMLTLISFSGGPGSRLKRRHYDRVRQIALVDTITFAAAITWLLVISVPLAESAEIPSTWYRVVYYVTLVYAAALGGALIAVVLLLYNAISDLIGVVHPDEESDLVTEEGSRE